MSLFVFLFNKCVATVEIFLDKGIFDLRNPLALLPSNIFLGAAHGEQFSIIRRNIESKCNLIYSKE